MHPEAPIALAISYCKLRGKSLIAAHQAGAFSAAIVYPPSSRGFGAGHAGGFFAADNGKAALGGGLLGVGIFM